MLPTFRQVTKYMYSGPHTHVYGASLVAQLVKNPPAMQEAQLQSQGGEDPLEKEMATLSSILIWRTPQMGEPGRLQSEGLQSQTRLATKPPRAFTLAHTVYTHTEGAQGTKRVGSNVNNR